MGGIVVDSGKFDWAQNDKFKSLTEPEPAYHGLRFHETFGDLAFTVHGPRDRACAISAPTHGADERLPDDHRASRRCRCAWSATCENAQAVAEFLERHPAVSWVSYAGLEIEPLSRARQEIPAARARARSSPSASRAATRPASSWCEGVELLSHLANIGDTRSLILHPASTTHRQLTEEQQIAAGAGPDVVRLSIGLETVDDIIADLDQALGEGRRSRPISWTRRSKGCASSSPPAVPASAGASRRAFTSTARGSSCATSSRPRSRSYAGVEPKIGTVLADVGDPAAVEPAFRRPRSRRSAAWTCWSTTPASPARPPRPRT